jgi:N-acetylglucosamine-6-phosphate deacetylase
MTRLEAGHVLTADGWIGPTALRIDDGIITAINPASGDIGAHARERTLTAGFVDLQVNGIDDIDVATARGADWERLDELLIAQGVTTWCPTLISMPLDRFAQPLERIAGAMARPAGRRPAVAGAHLEGPFLGGAPGAHPPEHIVPVDLEWLRKLPNHVAVVTLAAEQHDATRAIAELVARGVLVSIGHSTADLNEFDAAVSAGARLVTHLFNGMSGVHHRDPGVAVFALTSPTVSASLIADNVHVHPRVLRLAAQALGDQRMVLVTDAVAWRAGTVGEIGIELRDGAPRLPNGTLAGSALTMDGAVRNCVAAGIDLRRALDAASSTPARLLALSDRGAIRVGARADLVALTSHLEVEQVWIAGEAV